MGGALTSAAPLSPCGRQRAVAKAFFQGAIGGLMPRPHSCLLSGLDRAASGPIPRKDVLSRKERGRSVLRCRANDEDTCLRGNPEPAGAFAAAV